GPQIGCELSDGDGRIRQLVAVGIKRLLDGGAEMWGTEDALHNGECVRESAFVHVRSRFFQRLNRGGCARLSLLQQQLCEPSPRRHLRRRHSSASKNDEIAFLEVTLKALKYGV